MARTKKATKEVSTETGTITFNFDHGKQYVADISRFSQDIVKRLALHGLSQKLGDSYSGLETPEEAEVEVQRVFGDLEQGVWANRSAAGAGLSHFVEALQRLTEKDTETVRKFIEGLTDEQVEALKKNENVKAVVAAIKAEKAAARVGGTPTLDLNAAVAASAAAPEEAPQEAQG